MTTEEAQALVGQVVSFNGLVLSRIVRTRTNIYGWVFDLANGHCIRDCRGCAKWSVSTPVPAPGKED